MTLTRTCVLAYMHSDALEALAAATHLSPVSLGLLLRYLTRPPCLALRGPTSPPPTG
ncbi:hypothetical protein ACFQYP_64955 [Nonomuraea antimicrobica]